ncbi:MAG: hypothetical protein R3C05_12925 [Pirellulaceae bacterium]
MSDAQTVDADGIVDGTLHKSGEVDRFNVSLKKGSTFVAALQANHRLGSPMDSVLQISNTDGFVLAQNDDDVGIDPKLVFEVPRDGSYIVNVFAFPSTPNSTINFSGGSSYVYRLTLATGGFVEHCLPLAKQRTEDQVFSLQGWNLPASETQPKSIAGSEDNVYVIHPEATSFVEVPNVDLPVLAESDVKADTPINVPVVISGVISQPNETDSYVIEGVKDKSIRCVVDSDALGFRLDPVVVLWDSTGKQISKADDASRDVRDATLTHKFAADGIHRLTVEDLYHDGGARYAYRLTITESKPEFKLSVQAESFIVKKGNKLEIPVTIEREKGFDAEIEVSVSGTPDGIKVAPAKSEAKGDTSKAVKLELTAGDQSFNGPIVITGRSTGETSIERHAQFKVANTQQRSSKIWLTITK